MVIEVIIIFALTLVIFLTGTLIGVAKREYDRHCEMEEQQGEKNNQVNQTHIKQ